MSLEQASDGKDGFETILSVVEQSGEVCNRNDKWHAKNAPTPHRVFAYSVTWKGDKTLPNLSPKYPQQ